MPYYRYRDPYEDVRIKEEGPSVTMQQPASMVQQGHTPLPPSEQEYPSGTVALPQQPTAQLPLPQDVYYPPEERPGPGDDEVDIDGQAEEDEGGSRWLLLVGTAAVVGGIVYFAVR